MATALSIDLRVRVLAAVAAGLSHRAAGDRFGVSAASVSRWRALTRECGEPKPKALGGDRRSGRVEGCKDVILAIVAETPDLGIEEIRAVLAARGHAFGYGTIHRFLKRHKMSRKKRPRTRVSRTALTS